VSLASLAADLPTVALTAGAMAAHQIAGAAAAQGSVAKLAKLIEEGYSANSSGKYPICL
jgi:hypothetical protein